MPDRLKALARLFPALLPALCDPEVHLNTGDPVRLHPRLAFNQHKSNPYSDSQPEHEREDVLLEEPLSLYDAWLASRTYVTQVGPDGKLVHHPRPPGSTRQFNLSNCYLAAQIIHSTFLEIVLLLWGLNPIRTLVLIGLTIIRGLLPAFRGYSHALILDEVQKLISSGDFPSTRLFHLVAREGFRMLVERLFDAFSEYNESVVHSSVQFVMERRQLEQRLRLDAPTLADPIIHDLLHESDMFARSFTSFGRSFGIFSPFDIIHTLSSVAELASQLLILYTASGAAGSSIFSFGSSSTSDPSRPQLSLLGIILLPSLISLLAARLPALPFATSSGGDQCDTPYTAAEFSEYERMNRMRSMATVDSYHSEVALFGLAPWILSSWSDSRKRILGLDSASNVNQATLSFGSGLRWLLTQTNLSEMIVLLQNLPFLIYTSSTSLGSLALYRNSVQSLIFTARSIAVSCDRAYQSVFLMGAFFAASAIEPKLAPPPGKEMKYKVSKRGVKIEARNLSFTYPGNNKTTLHNVNFVVEAGETLAIVGYNGSGKSTLANILLRIFDFDSGQLLINGTDIRLLDPQEYHKHVTALFQIFSKLSTTVRENVGIGDVDSKFSDHAVREAAHRAGATGLVNSLPRGLDTTLESDGMGLTPFGEGAIGINIGEIPEARQGLSGGEWQRLAISRTFMRAQSADLILLDEPTSHLDARAQNNVLETIESLCRDNTGKKVKTVIVITHQLSIARRADKIAMFENGTITEFGTHDDLMALPDSQYASLYRSTV